MYRTAFNLLITNSRCGFLLPRSRLCASNLHKYWSSQKLRLNARHLSVTATCRTERQTELTSVTHPLVKRGNYATLNDEDLKFFHGVLPDTGQVLTADAEDLDGYNVDWIRTVRGAGQVVLRPKTTEDVSKLLAYCNSRSLAVVPQGGNTGLVAGSVPVFDEVILSTQLMNNIISLDQVSGALVCQAGCILENLDNYLASYDLMMPLDLGAKGSCQIGGNVSTNAGGVRLLRYGSLHGSVLGVEAVLANGEVVDCLSSLRKDNTGYDMKQLFIGSEGTLGVVTGVSILCPRRPYSTTVAFLACDSYDNVLHILQEAKGQLAEILSAYEYLDHACIECVRDNLGLNNPLTDAKFYVLIETGGSNAQHDEDKMSVFLEETMAMGLVIDGTMATESLKMTALWELRERINESLLINGRYCYKYDLSLPQTQFVKLVEIMRERLAGKVERVVGYGHVGDGNLHLNAVTPQFDPEVKTLIEPFIYEWTAKHHGSISAEHGLGFMKNNYIGYSKSKAAVDWMLKIKTLFDPNGILNPYKTLPAQK